MLAAISEYFPDIQIVSARVAVGVYRQRFRLYYNKGDNK